eukprot:g998.t1
MNKDLHQVSLGQDGGEARVVVSCPEAHYDKVQKICMELDIVQAFGRKGDYVDDLDGDEWFGKWQSRVVASATTALQTRKCKNAELFCIAGKLAEEEIQKDAKLRKRKLLDLLEEDPQAAELFAKLTDYVELDEKSKRLVIIGDTGAGKSTFCGLLDGSLQKLKKGVDDKGMPLWEWESNFKLGHKASSETDQPQLRKCYAFGQDGEDPVPLLLMDTPGLEDSRGKKKDDDHMAEVAKWVNGLRYIHGIVILLKNDTRISRGLRNNLEFFQSIFGTDMWVHATVVVNRLTDPSIPKAKTWLEETQSALGQLENAHKQKSMEAVKQALALCESLNLPADKLQIARTWLKAEAKQVLDTAVEQAESIKKVREALLFCESVGVPPDDLRKAHHWLEDEQKVQRLIEEFDEKYGLGLSKEFDSFTKAVKLWVREHGVTGTLGHMETRFERLKQIVNEFPKMTEVSKIKVCTLIKSTKLNPQSTRKEWQDVLDPAREHGMNGLQLQKLQTDYDNRLFFHGDIVTMETNRWDDHYVYVSDDHNYVFARKRSTLEGYELTKASWRLHIDGDLHKFESMKCSGRYLCAMDHETNKLWPKGLRPAARFSNGKLLSCLAEQVVEHVGRCAPDTENDHGGGGAGWPLRRASRPDGELRCLSETLLSKIGTWQSEKPRILKMTTEAAVTLGLVVGNFPWSLGGELWGIAEPGEEDVGPVTQGKRQVDYRRFLRRFDVAVNKEKWIGWKTILMKDAYEALYCRDADLILGCKREPSRPCQQLKVLQSEVCFESSDSPQRTSQHVLSASQLQSLAHGLFPPDEGDEDTDLSVHEFFERFTVIYRQAKAMTGDDTLSDWRTTLRSLGHLLLKQDRKTSMTINSFERAVSRVRTGASTHSRKTLLQVQRLAHQFESGDESGNGLLSRQELDLRASKK